MTLRVKDRGVGIPPNLLPRIFELFVQGNQGLARANGGLGVGLSLVKRLVELHGGTIEAFSKGIAGEGSECVIHLRCLASAPEPEHPRAERPDHQVSLRVLIVEDNVDSAESIAELVKLWGQEAKVAPNGVAALEIAHRFPPEVVLCDLGLPGMDGFEVARQLRQQQAPPRQVLVALTGYERTRIVAGLKRQVSITT